MNLIYLLISYMLFMPCASAADIKRFMLNNDVPGIAVCIFDGQVGVIHCYGVRDVARNIPVTPDTLFEIASITKVFTATDLALQVEEGHMALHDSITRYLPELDKSEAPINKVTLEELATHTSSLPRGLPARYSRKMVLAFLRDWAPMYPIGSHYLYSNLAFGVLGYALEAEEKEPLEQLLNREILHPLGMNETFITVPQNLYQNLAQGYSPRGSPVPANKVSAWPAGGALKSTPSDMLKFLKFNLGVLGPNNLQRAMQLAHKGYFKVNDHLTMGLGWQHFTHNGVHILDKNGGLAGFSSYIGMIPDRKLGIVILANKSKVNCTKLGRSILSAS